MLREVVISCCQWWITLPASTMAPSNLIINDISIIKMLFSLVQTEVEILRNVKNVQIFKLMAV